MKGLSVVVVSLLLMSLMTGTAFAANYNIDYLEAGNPGGWGTSKKTFDSKIAVAPGSTFVIDIWTHASGWPDPYAGGFWIDFQEDADKLSIKDIKIYNNKDDGLPGPWAHSGPAIIGPIQKVPDGVALNASLNIDQAPLDDDDDIILARIELLCEKPGPATITVKTIPDFGTWASPPWDDAKIKEATLSLSNAATGGTGSGLRWRPGCFIGTIAD